MVSRVLHLERIIGCLLVVDVQRCVCGGVEKVFWVRAETRRGTGTKGMVESRAVI
jgi:hypothetical protein